MTWTLVKGHKGPVNGLRASGPQGSDPLYTQIHTHTQGTFIYLTLITIPLS